MAQNHSEATILVPGVQKRVVKALLDFFYTGQMTVERQDTSDLQLLIDTLQIDPGLITVDTMPEVESNPEPKIEKSEKEINVKTKGETDSASKISEKNDATTKTVNQKNEKSLPQTNSNPKPGTS